MGSIMAALRTPGWRAITAAPRGDTDDMGGGRGVAVNAVLSANIFDRAWFAVAFGFVYFFAAVLGEALSIEPGHFATLWPPSGLYLAALLSAPGQWRRIVLAAVAANLLFDAGLHGRPLTIGLGFALANTCEALAGAAVIGRFFKPPFRLESVRAVLALTALAALAGPAVGAAVGAAVVVAAFNGDFSSSFALWWAADSIGIVIAAPLTMLTLHDYGQRRLDAWRYAELCALFATLFAATIGIVHFLGSVTSFGFLLIPVMLWAALRFGLPGSAVVVSVLALLAAYLTARSNDSAVAAEAASHIVSLQLFLATIALSTYLVAVLVSQLRAARAQLEQRVAQRTSELAVSEERLRLAVETGRMFAFDWDAVSGEVKRSAGADRVLQMSGGSERDSGVAYLRRIQRQDRQRYQDIILGLSHDKPEYELRYTLRRDDGSDLVLQERGRAYFDARGRMTRVLGISADVTAHARVEQALHEQEAEFRQIANSAPAILWITDERGAVRFVSSSWQDFTGQIEADALGMGWLDVVHPEDRDAVRARYDADLRQRREIMASYRLRRADGSYSWVLDRARARHSAAGDLIGYVGSTMDVSEQKRIEVELQQSKQRLGLALAAGHMGTFDWDLRSGDLTVDAVQAELIGSDPATRSIEGVLERVLPEDRPGVQHAFAQALERGDYQHEFRVQLGDAGVRWLAGRGGLRRDESGIAQALVGVTWDVTVRKEQEAQLRRSEERLRNTVESAQIGIAYGDSTGAILDCNDSLLRMLASPQPGRTDAPALAWNQFFPAQDERLLQAVEAVARGESVGPMEVALRRLDGSPIEALWSMVPLGHEPGAHVAMLVDLRELKSAQRQAQESARFSARISDIVPALLYVYDTQRHSALYCNRHAAQVVGYSPEEMLGMGGEFLSRMLHPDDLDRFLAHVEALEGAAEGESRNLEYRMRHRDGSWRWILGRESVLLRDQEGRVVQVMGAAADVSELKRAEHALREADRRKDEYLAILAHELRNPLAPIRNAANILGLPQPSEAQSKWARELIARQVDQLARLIDDLLDVSRISRGKLVLRKEPTTLAAVLECAGESCAPLIARHRHTMRTHLPQVPVPLIADVVRLAQVFVNLLSNAAKYTPNGGEIDVTAQCEDEGVVVVRVRDNGIGIPPEKLPHLFEMFYQVDSSLERAHGGLGIGLTLVERLLHLHGGTVSASSGGIGRGSEFSVRLPIMGSFAPQALPTLAQPRAAPTGRRVVVADDNADSAESLALLLSMNGDEVFVAYDGQAALELIAEHAPDVALLDIGMPRLNGYDVARRARTLPAAKATLLIALTGWGQAEDVRRSLDAGFDVHLTKPLDFARLAALLEERTRPASH